MENLKHIEELLAKYYRAETSIAEENTLSAFFQAGDFPDHLSADARLFGYYTNKKENSLSGEMEAKLDRMIDGSKPRKLTLGMGLKYYWISGAAAVILILLGIFVDKKILENPAFEVRQDTYEDPYLAYIEAKKVLYLVSEKLNTGREPLQNLEKLESGVNYMHPVFSFGASIQHLEQLSTIEKTRKLISK